MTVTRVRYRERQALRAIDLLDEQAYRLMMRRRHHIGHHGWGIVIGLELVFEGGRFVVTPGMAVDGYGRELIVPEPVALPMEICDEPVDIFEALGENIDVWLLYGRVAETPPQRGRYDCGPGQHSRWREEARLRLTAADTINPRRPVEVPDADLDFGPHETPPDDPEREWPIFLGRITRTTTDLANRPYVTLVGELIVAPSSRARMQVGSELAGDRQRFAVSMPDESDAFTNRLTIDGDGKTTLRGNTTLVDGDLIIAEAEARAVPVIASRLARLCGRGEGSTDEDQVWSIAFKPMDIAPEEATPWRIYHTIASENDIPIDQLRLEIGHPGDEGDPAKHRLAVGSWSDDESRFQPCLTVDANCTVIIRGDIQVEGSLKESPVTADPTDPRFAEVIGTRWAQGLLVTGAGTLYGTGLEITEISCTANESFDVITYEITVRNTSGSPISNINLVENLSIDGLPVRRGLIAREFTLSSETQSTITHTYESHSGSLEDREIILAVTALGIGPANIPISASASETLKCGGPIIE